MRHDGWSIGVLDSSHEVFVVRCKLHESGTPGILTRVIPLFPDFDPHMNIAYISADFGVPIFGFKGASIHVREMCSALRQSGHAVCVISPATAPEAATAQGPNVFHGEAAPPASPFSPPAQSRAQLTYLPVAPHARQLQLIKDCEALDKFWGMKTRLRQELRNQLYNLTLYDATLEYLRAHPVDFVYERYSLFSCAG